MFSFIQILLCLVAINYGTCIPIFGEFRFKKHFEVEHKPPPLPHFKPIELIKEIVTPFGKFGMKHAIGKRDLDNMKTVDEPEKISMPPPKTEDRYEVNEPTGPIATPVPPMMGPVTPSMGPVIEGGPIPAEMTPHFVEIKPIPAPPPPPVFITPPPPRVVEQSPPRGFNTDIAREQAINEYLKLVEREPVIPPAIEPVGPPLIPVGNNIEPEKPKEEPKVEEPPPNPIVRGSRLALYFGNVLLDVLSNLFLGGRFAELINRPVTI